MSRRSFIQTSAAAGAAAGVAMWGAPSFGARLRDTKLRVLSIGVIGTIGEADRHNVAAHPDAEIVGLCDIDAEFLAKAGGEHPDAFRCEDYREAFAKYGDKFDAVIVSTPDHSHCAIMTTALAHDKHVYGQKPLVHELEELETLGRAVKAKPNLVTQTGAQRIAHPARRAAVDILRGGGLGKVIEAHVVFGNGRWRAGSTSPTVCWAIRSTRPRASTTTCGSTGRSSSRAGRTWCSGSGAAGGSMAAGRSLTGWCI
ncbi:MAG: Gfo/Idh/MocA family oxidoreductase [Phycisphaerales bacterium]|nr:Gfo/Idh/MocA family oxidoreductase [Phycisphaerales bacterium]